MLTAPVDGRSPEALLARYAEPLARVVADRGAKQVVEEAGVDGDAVDAIERGDAGALDLRDAAAVLALAEGAPDADALRAEVRDHLLLEMSSAMLDVDRLAAALDGDLDPKEVQGKLEGRHPMTLAEYARLHHAVAGGA